MKQKTFNIKSSNLGPSDFDGASEKKCTQNTPPKSPEQRRMEDLKKRREVLKYLEKTYPKVFNRSQLKPLKTGILEDLVALDGFPFSKKRLRDALQLYVSFTRYLQCFQIYSERYDLDGNPCDILKESEKEYAQNLLDVRFLKMKERQNRENKEEDSSSPLFKNSA